MGVTRVLYALQMRQVQKEAYQLKAEEIPNNSNLDNVFSMQRKMDMFGRLERDRKARRILEMEGRVFVDIGGL